MKPAKKFPEVVAVERVVLDTDEPAAEAEDRRAAGDQQQIARPPLRHLRQHPLERIPLGHRLRRALQRRPPLVVLIQLLDELVELLITCKSSHRQVLTNEACQKLRGAVPGCQSTACATENTEKNREKGKST